MKYRKYSITELETCISDVQAGLSYGAASKKYGIPKTTIADHVSGRSTVGSKSGRQAVIPETVEKQIVQQALTAADQGYGLTRKQVSMKAGQVCSRLSLRTPFKGGVPGPKWFRGLKKRHPEISVKKPQKILTSRAKMMSREVVAKYFNELNSLLESLRQNKTKKLWNMDESGFHLEHRPVSVVARKGCQVNSRVGCNRENITVVACCNANGECMPPAFIVKGKTERSLASFVQDDGPEGAHWTYQGRAWQEGPTMVEWFREIFLKYCGPERPQLLILDQHASHEVMDLLEEARTNNVVLLGLPPHTSHWLQPLDKGCFGPLSAAYDRICSEYMSRGPAFVLCKPVFARLFKQAWNCAMTSTNIKKGFEVTGITPYNPHRIPDNAYLPSDVYVNYQPSASTSEETPSASTTVDVTPAASASTDEFDVVLPVPAPGTSCTFTLPTMPSHAQSVHSVGDVVQDIFSLDTGGNVRENTKARKSIPGHMLLTADSVLEEQKELSKRKQLKESSKDEGKGKG